MNVSTPALHVRPLEVYKAFFQAQIADTVSTLRQQLREWSVVHVVLLQAGALRRGLSNDEMAKLVLQGIGADGARLEPGVTVDQPAVPEGTLVSVMPDAIRPKIVAEYDGWAWLPFVEFRRRLREFGARAFGAGAAEGSIGGLFDLKDHPVALDAGSTTAASQFARALEMVCPKEGTVWFCDGSFGFQAPAATFLAQAGPILHMPGRSREMLYFGDRWFAAFHPNGRVRVAMIEEGQP